MNRNLVRYLGLAAICICFGFAQVQAEGLRSIGLRVAISWSDTPIWIGIEASTELSFSVLSGSLFITPDGKTLFMAHLDVPLQENGSAFLRLTGGFYYFGPRQPLPYPLAGVGLSYLAIAVSPIYFAFSGEFVYPLAFPLPMFSISGGWLP
ncbi:hypothetical protein KKG90_01900 [Candidatus Bipolaricaulota bacterium]|nr:hypothetical protein [Candidatus Bipolaricaulota bacterium]